MIGQKAASKHAKKLAKDKANGGSVRRLPSMPKVKATSGGSLFAAELKKSKKADAGGNGPKSPKSFNNKGGSKKGSPSKSKKQGGGGFKKGPKKGGKR